MNPYDNNNSSMHMQRARGTRETHAMRTCPSLSRKTGSFSTTKSLGPLWHPSTAAVTVAAVEEEDDAAVVASEVAHGKVTKDGSSPPPLLPLLLVPLPLALPVALAWA